MCLSGLFQLLVEIFPEIESHTVNFTIIKDHIEERTAKQLLIIYHSFSLETYHSTFLCLLMFLHGEGNGTPLQYSCLENPMDGGAWQAADHGVAKSWKRLSDFTSLMFLQDTEIQNLSSTLYFQVQLGIQYHLCTLFTEEQSHLSVVSLGTRKCKLI